MLTGRKIFRWDRQKKEKIGAKEGASDQPVGKTVKNQLHIFYSLLPRSPSRQEVSQVSGG